MDDSTGSVWASLGGDSLDSNPKSSAFALSEPETRDDIMGLDDRWVDPRRNRTIEEMDW
jgi:hypothetical protein